MAATQSALKSQICYLAWSYQKLIPPSTCHKERTPTSPELHLTRYITPPSWLAPPAVWHVRWVFGEHVTSMPLRESSQHVYPAQRGHGATHKHATVSRAAKAVPFHSSRLAHGRLVRVAPQACPHLNHSYTPGLLTLSSVWRHELLYNAGAYTSKLRHKRNDINDIKPVPDLTPKRYSLWTAHRVIRESREACEVSLSQFRHEWTSLSYSLKYKYTNTKLDKQKEKLLLYRPY